MCGPFRRFWELVELQSIALSWKWQSWNGWVELRWLPLKMGQFSNKLTWFNNMHDNCSTLNTTPINWACMCATAGLKNPASCMCRMHCMFSLKLVDVWWKWPNWKWLIANDSNWMLLWLQQATLCGSLSVLNITCVHRATSLKQSFSHQVGWWNQSDFRLLPTSVDSFVVNNCLSQAMRVIFGDLMNHHMHFITATPSFVTNRHLWLHPTVGVLNC